MTLVNLGEGPRDQARRMRSLVLIINLHRKGTVMKQTIMSLAATVTEWATLTIWSFVSHGLTRHASRSQPETAVRSLTGGIAVCHDACHGGIP
jgi:hypothetical protein